LKQFSGNYTGVFLIAVLVFGLAVGLVGCGGTSGSNSGKITLTDDNGRTLVMEKPADRVVSLAPSNTEIIYAIGGQKKLVGVTTYCDYPPAAKKMVKIGDFSTPNVEKIASRNPQVVIATGGVQAGAVTNLEKLGIKVFVVDPKTFNGLFADMERVGEIMGLKDQAGAKVDALRKRVTTVESKSKNLSRPTAFFEIYAQPLMTAGKGTLIDSMISMAGGTNLGAAAGPDFPQYSQETLLQDNPDVYIAVKGTQTNPGDIMKRPGYETIKAVKDGKVYVVEDNLFVRSGPRLVDGLEQLAAMFHPEVFKTQR